MARRFKRRLFANTLSGGSNLGTCYHALPDGSKVTADPARAMQWRRDGLNVRPAPRLGHARLGPMITENWPDGWQAPPAKEL